MTSRRSTRFKSDVAHYGEVHILHFDPFSAACLSCSRSRGSGAIVRFPPRRMGPAWRCALAETGPRRRRLNKLSCAGWLPHDRGFVSGLPRSKGRASVRGPAHNRPGGFPTVILSRHAGGAHQRCAIVDLLALYFGDHSALECRLRNLDGGPDEANHLAGDRGGHNDLRLAGRGQAPIARAQPSWPFPAMSRMAGGSPSLLAADPCRHAVGPGAFDQRPPRQHTTGLGDAATPYAAPGRNARTAPAEIGHQLPRFGKAAKGRRPRRRWSPRPPARRHALLAMP